MVWRKITINDTAECLQRFSSRVTRVSLESTNWWASCYQVSGKWNERAIVAIMSIRIPFMHNNIMINLKGKWQHPDDKLKMGVSYPLTLALTTLLIQV